MRRTNLYGSYLNTIIKSFTVKVICLIIINVCYAINIKAQLNFTGTNEIGITSPTAANLTKYGSIPVNLATGVPNISIPLTILKAGTLQLPISLNYHSGGIKVTEYPGEIGLGWSLQSAGVISRVVVGMPDEYNKAVHKGYYHQQSEIEGYYNFGVDDSSMMKSYLLDLVANKIEATPDIYSYNFGGKSGFFVIDGAGEFVAFPDADFDVEYSRITGDYAVQSFVITTLDGTKYTFDEKEYTQKLYTVDEFPEEPSFPNWEPPVYGVDYPTAWYLTKIENPSQQQYLYFSYETVDGTNDITSIGSSTMTNNLDIDIVHNECPTTWNIGSSYSRYLISKYKRIKELRVVGDNNLSRVIIDYEDNINNFPMDYKISEIRVWSGRGVLDKKFVLSTTNDPGIGSLMMLESVQEISGNNVFPPYQFSYYGNGITQERQSVNRDYLGYPRGNRNVVYDHLVGIVETSDGDIIGASRAPSFEHTINGILSKITYPTGGTTEFQYELNTADIYGEEKPIGGLRIHRIISNARSIGSSPTVKTYQYGKGNAEFIKDIVRYGVKFDPLHLYMTKNGEDCYQETGVSEPNLPLYGHYVVYDYVREIINNYEGGAYVEEYDTRLSNNGTYKDYEGGGDFRYYRKSLITRKAYEIKADTVNLEIMSPYSLPTYEENYEYNIEKGASVGGTFSDIISLKWLTPNIKIYKEINSYNPDDECYEYAAVWCGSELSTTKIDTTFKVRHGLYSRMWAYPTKKISKTNEFVWMDTTHVDVIDQTNDGYWVYPEDAIPYYFDPTNDYLLVFTDSSRYVVDKNIESIEEYEYDDANHKQITKSIKSNPNTSSNLITIYGYAHNQDQFSDMKELNMLMQPYSLEVQDGNNVVKKKNWILWKNWGTQSNPQWLPCGTWAWDGALVSGIPVAPTSCN